MHEDAIQTTEAAAQRRLGPPRKRWGGYLNPAGSASWPCGCRWDGAGEEGNGLLHACGRHAGQAAEAA